MKLSDIFKNKKKNKLIQIGDPIGKTQSKTMAKINTVEFEAILSGDYECFCFDVDKETFESITGNQAFPFCESQFNENKYKLYMEDILKPKSKKLKIKIIYEDV